MDSRELKAILLGIDEEASLSLPPLPLTSRVVLVGGSALMLRDLTTRPATHDIDVLQADSIIRTIISRYPQVNSSVQAYADHIPYNFEDRLEVLDIGARRIEYLTPALEDLAVMKLYAWRQNDIADLTSERFVQSINWALLRALVYDPNEARASVLSERRWREMAAIFEQYESRWRR